MSSTDGGSVADEATSDDATPEPEDAVEVDERREALVAALGDGLGDALLATHIDPGREVWARVSLEAWVTAGAHARDRLGLRFFEFLSAIDWMPSPFGRDMDSQEDLEVHGGPEKAPDEQITGYAGGDTRFQLLARLHNPVEGIGLILKADLGDDPEALIAPTWVSLFAGAQWHEREAWEMFGIVFEGNPNLTHLYLPGEFEGHPLRKDFPLLSRRVKPWPGIVDVEPMPGEDEAAEDTSEAEANEDAIEGSGG